MTAQERLAAAIADVDRQCDPESIDVRRALGLLASDPALAQDIEDGAALRRLREAPGTWQIGNVRALGSTVGYAAEAWSYSAGRLVKVLGHDDPDMMPPTYPTIAEAADACREAIEAGRS